MRIHLTRLDACGNTFHLLDAVADPSAGLHAGLSDLTRTLCDRETSHGADGLLVLQSSPDSGFAVAIYNADGSDGQMSVNGVRCAALYAAGQGYVAPSSESPPVYDATIHVADRAVGLRVLRPSSDPGIGMVSAAMGLPVFELERIPVRRGHLGPIESFADAESIIDGTRATFASMGNPHMVCFVDPGEDALNIQELGARFEAHDAFPNRMNVHIATVEGRDALRLESWERGCGPTRSCGSGACAAVAAGVLTNRLDESVSVRMPGGDVTVTWDRDAGDGMVLTGFVRAVGDLSWEL